MSTTNSSPGAYLAPCRDDIEPCEAQHSSGYVCTRNQGHKGDHAAHDPRKRMVKRWPADGTGEPLDSAIETIDDATEPIAALRRDLAAAQEARLAAELRAQGLRGALEGEQLGKEIVKGYLRAQHGTDHDTCPFSRPAILAAQPPDLAPLRDLLQAARKLADHWDGALDREHLMNEFSLRFNRAVAAYPFLDPGAEPAGEVSDG